MQKSYHIDSRLDFGMYDGYRLGVVYLFDPEYLEWCIKHINRFHLHDINQYKQYKVYYKNPSIMHRIYKEPHILSHYIDYFDTIEEFISILGPGSIEFYFSEEVITLNNSRV
jgi:hypothetical protein